MKAFILAGGFATRLWPLTEKRAKPLLPLAGIPLLTHLVEKIPAGIPITVSTNAVFAEDFEKWKKAMSDKRLAISILIEDAGHEDEKLGALGAVAKWVKEENIQDDVLLLAGDNYVGFSITSFIERFGGKPLLAAYDIREQVAAKKFGIVFTETKPNISGTIRVNGFEEKPAKPKSTLVSTGCYILPGDSLSTLVSYAKDHPDNIGGIFEHFLSMGMEVECVSFAEPWFDIGSFEAYLEATKTLIGENFLLADGALQKESELKGSIVFGKNSKAARSTLTNVVLFENCEVEDCVLENCIVDDDCILRGVDLSGKMLRARTRLIRRHRAL